MSRLNRQQFLGPESDKILDAATVAVVGLGGGGSHVSQQFAHMGLGGHVVVDPQSIDLSNTNRLVGGTLIDVAKQESKVAIAERMIRNVQRHPRVVAIRDSWHSAIDTLKRSEVIVGAVDTFGERDQLERFARRHLIPYVDIGMDVHGIGKDGFLIGGQVILSMPGTPCLRCYGFLTDQRLKEEAKHYGDAGPRPQVVWPNGVLASTAVGIVAQLLTPWFAGPPASTYLEYDGNRGTVTVSPRVALLQGHVCPHHPLEEAGDPLFDIRTHGARARLRAPDRQPWWRRLLARFGKP